MSAITVPYPAGAEKFTEEQFQQHVVDAAGFHGWWNIHHRNSLANPIWVDLLLLRQDEYRVLELKSMRGKVSAHQRRLHETLAAYGVVVHVIFPTEADWERLQTLLR